MRRRRICFFLLLTVILTLFTGCGKTQPPLSEAPESLAPAPPPDTISFEGTVFSFNDTDFDITEREASVNLIMDCTIVSPYVIVEGHIGPQNGYYGIFNTITESFEKDLYGNHLIYRDNDVSTIVYSFWNEIYTYDGTLVAACNLPETSRIYSLSFSEDGTAVQAEIQDIEIEPPQVELYQLPSF